MNRCAFRASIGKLLPLLALLAAMLATQPAIAQEEQGNCLDDVTGRTNVCRAGDVQLSTLMNIEDTTCMPGELVTLNLQVRLLATAAERYDIGMFLALDGGDARTGLCQHDYLRPPLSAGGLCSGSGDDCKKDVDCPVDETCTGGYNPGSPDSGGGPFYNAEPGDPLDACGDLEQGVDTYYRLAPVTVECIDSDGDGLLNIGTAVSWDNNPNGDTCQGVDGAVPNTPAKCRYATIDVANVIVSPGLLRVQKTAEPEELPEPGGWVTYTIVVENTSLDTVRLEELDDSIYGPLEQAEGSDCELPQTLDPGETYTCTLSAEVMGEAGSIFENVVIASGTAVNKNPVSGVDPAVVTIVPDSGMGMPAAVVTGGMTTVGLTLLVAGALLRRRIA